MKKPLLKFYWLLAVPGALLTLLLAGSAAKSNPPAAVGSAGGQGSAPQPSPAPGAAQDFSLTLRPASKVWDSRTPLVVDLSFKNESDERIFINLKSAYQVTGFLEDKSGHVFEVEWSPQGASRSPVREDYAELAPGGTLALTLTSKKIRSEGGDGAIPWRTHRPGDYKLYVQFASGSKTYLMPNQWEGMTTSSDVTIRVR